jgi:hypothetical protein
MNFDKDALDRYITGNYGEDQFKNQDDYDERVSWADVENARKPMNPEQRKYQAIYKLQHHPGFGELKHYGHSNHGGDRALKVLCETDGRFPQSILDIGCGHNEFITSVRMAYMELIPNAEGVNTEVKYVGTDFACPSADYQLDFTEDQTKRFGHKEFQFTTAFDVLEHLQEGQIDQFLFNCKWASLYSLFTISHRPSTIMWAGQPLHMTVRSETWWREKLLSITNDNMDGPFVSKKGKFWHVEWQ